MMKIRKTRLTYLLLGLYMLIFGGVALVEGAHRSGFIHAASPNPAYAPQPGRNAEWGGPANFNPLTAAYLQSASRDVSYNVVENSLADTNMSQQFARVSQLAAAGGPEKIFEYFNSTIMYTSSLTAWAPYTASFSPGWYLQDSQGNPVQHTPSGVFNGYWMDVTNPAYRDWAVNTISAWMTQAPLKGIALDSADALVGTAVRSSFNNTHQNLNTLLCGAGAPVDASGNCSRVAAWNAGLATMLSQITQKLHTMGDEVIYNGVAPSPARDAGRNTSLLADADMASNESFCYDVTPGAASTLNLEPIAADADMMRQQAGAGKKLMEITNHMGDGAKQALAPYCLAGFLMGWQPGYDVWVYHNVYNAAFKSTYPEEPEQDLNLGNPLTSSYSQSGAVLSRSFQNGFVAVNTGASAASVKLPGKLVQFAGGNQLQTYDAGAAFPLAPHSGAFFLADSYLNPGSGSASPGGGAGTSGGASGGTSIAASKPLTGQVSGDVRFQVPAGAGYTKVEYSLNGKLVHTATRFPDDWSLDTRGLANGIYVLSVKYYKADGSVSTSSQQITVFNPHTLGEELTSLRQRYAAPTLSIMAAAVLALFLVHHWRLFRPRWLYAHHTTALTSGIHVAAVLQPPAIPLPTAPGTVIQPNRTASEHQKPPED